MLPEVAWAICAEDNEEPFDEIFVDLRVMAPVLAVALRSSEEAFALIAELLKQHGMRAQCVRIEPCRPEEPQNPPKQKISAISDILANCRQRDAQRRLTNIKQDSSRRRVSEKEERKTA